MQKATIQFVDNIPGSTTPARVFHKTGIIQVNMSRWPYLPEFTRKFILEHEKGHYYGNTNNEFVADKYAFDTLKLTEPYSLRNSVKALSDVLPMTTPEQTRRVDNAIIRALIVDAKKNPKARAALQQYYPNIPVNFEGESSQVDTKTILIILAVLIAVVIGAIYISKV